MRNENIRWLTTTVTVVFANSLDSDGASVFATPISCALRLSSSPAESATTLADRCSDGSSCCTCDLPSALFRNGLLAMRAMPASSLLWRTLTWLLDAPSRVDATEGASCTSRNSSCCASPCGDGCAWECVGEAEGAVESPNSTGMFGTNPSGSKSRSVSDCLGGSKSECAKANQRKQKKKDETEPEEGEKKKQGGGGEGGYKRKETKKSAGMHVCACVN